MQSAQGARLCRGGTSAATRRRGRPGRRDRVQRGDEHGTRAGVPARVPPRLVTSCAARGCLSGLSFPVCKVGWRREINEIVHVGHLPRAAQQLSY